MGFMKCPECGEEVSDIATMCPKCRYYFTSEEAATYSVRWMQREEKLKAENGGKLPEVKGDGYQKGSVIFGALFAVAIVIAYCVKNFL